MYLLIPQAFNHVFLAQHRFLAKNSYNSPSYGYDVGSSLLSLVLGPSSVSLAFCFRTVLPCGVGKGSFS